MTGESWTLESWRLYMRLHRGIDRMFQEAAKGLDGQVFLARRERDLLRAELRRERARRGI